MFTEAMTNLQEESQEKAQTLQQLRNTQVTCPRCAAANIFGTLAQPGPDFGKCAKCAGVILTNI